jgi:EAL domain-containing protein (putative c-di-GMP-specific phosphodiesterase class I)/GGDEF domain-containing protein
LQRANDKAATIMSLRTQLWIAVAVIMLLTALVSITVSTLSARHYLAQELRLKNIDNAASLALSLTQIPKDEARVELTLAAQFDTGHYRAIRLTDPRGRVIQERVHEPEPEGVPRWFVRLMAVDAPPGAAHISDGWSQFGTLTVESQTTHAYESLWQGTRRLAWIFVAGAILIGLLGTLYLNRCVRPLQDVVRQAEAVSQRRFITIAEPGTREFRAVAGAMNGLSRRVKEMLADESSRLQQLQARLLHDPLTGLLEREHLMTRFRVLLGADHAGATGTLILLRVQDLSHLNRELGREQIDTWLGRLGETLRALAGEREFGFAGRLNGSDFALISGDITDPPEYASTVVERIRMQVGDGAGEWTRIDFGVTAFRPGESPGDVFARGDSALARAELGSGFQAELELDGHLDGHRTQAQWRDAIRQALQQQGVQLAEFPVVNRSGMLIHTEAPVRLTIRGEIRPASYFLPWAVRLGLIRDLDDAVLSAALDKLDQGGGPMGINLSTESLRDTAFRQNLYRSLNQRPGTSSRLWLEFPAKGALSHVAELRELCLSLAPSGCKIGIEHAGPEVLDLQQLSELGLDYVKIDGAMIDGIHASAESQALVRGLCTAAHSIGVLIIAENCNNPDDLAVLPDLGMDGMTGTAIRLNTS